MIALSQFWSFHSLLLVIYLVVMIQFWSMKHNADLDTFWKGHFYWKRGAPGEKVLFSLLLHSLWLWLVGGFGIWSWSSSLITVSLKDLQKKVRINNRKIEWTWVPDNMLEPLWQTLKLTTFKVLVIWENEISLLIKTHKLYCSWIYPNRYIS